jgi:hypothetical protein
LLGIAGRGPSLDPMLEALGGIAVAAVLAFVGWRVAQRGGDGRRVHRLRRGAADRLPAGAGAGSLNAACRRDSPASPASSP